MVCSYVNFQLLVESDTPFCKYWILSIYMNLVKQIHRITQNNLHLSSLLFNFNFVEKM